MIVKQLGNSDIRLSAMGLGTWAIGGSGYDYGWGPQDDKDSIATIRRAIELGINWIDTAPVYGLGHSEEIVGEAIRGLRDRVFISTKCCFVWDENREISCSLKKNSIRTEVEASLRRLKLDVIDLYQIHKPIPIEDIEEGWSTLADLMKEGKIRYAGVSSFTLEQLKRVHAIHPVIFIQPGYNMIQNEIETDGVLEYCGLNNIGVVTYSSMYMGMLTGKFNAERVSNLPNDDYRRSEQYFNEPFLSENLRFVEKLRPIAERNNKTVAQLAIAWVLRRPEVTSAIVGARRPAQIEETIPAGDWVLSHADIMELDTVINEHHVQLKKLNSRSDDS